MLWRLALLPILTACLAAGTAALAQEQLAQERLAQERLAQERAGSAPAAEQAQEPPRRAPAARLDRGQRLDALYQALKAAPDARAAQAVEARIEAMQLQSGSDTADLLMARARGVMEAKDYDLSVELLDAIIELSPGYTEAYAQRATVLYHRKDLYGSLADLRMVIAREPRHFAALAGLGVILQDIGREALALDAFRRALAVNPHLRGVPELIQRLEPKVEGREI